MNTEKTYYQIQFVNKNGGYYEYFESPREEAMESALECANNFLSRMREKDRIHAGLIFYSPYKPIQTPRVVEYDRVKKQVKRGGEKN